jgi:hypothetical protein
MNTEWRVIVRGGAGIEFSLCGFGWGSDLFHRYIRCGLFTLYVTTTPLHDFLKRMKAAREALRGRG